MEVPASHYAWFLCVQLAAAGSMATVGSINLQWWWQDRSERALASTGFLCWSVALTLLVGALGLSFPVAEIFQVVVPLRAVLIGVTAALFLTTLGALVPLPALRGAVLAQVVLPLVYTTLGLTTDVSYVIDSGASWPRIQPLGGALAAASILIFILYAVKAAVGLKGAHRRGLIAATVSVAAVLAVALVAGPGALAEAMTSLWTLPIAVLLAWWCSARVLTLQGSLVSAEAGWRGAEDAARYQASHDRLTGLPNRLGAVEVLQSLLKANPDTRIVVMKFRVSQVEKVRAAAGSDAADLALRAIAGHLVAALPADAEVARVGEATFVVMARVPAGSPVAELEMNAEHLVALMQRTVAVPSSLVVSAGIAVSSRTITAPHLLQEAATAVIAAEQAPGRVQLFRPELRDQIVHWARITRLLSVAVDRDEFELHYQPVLDSTTLARVGVEALVRWRHHGRLHPPAEWIPVAEQQGLMPAIGLHVLRLAARDHAEVGCPIAVNVSAAQLCQPGFVDDVLDAVRGLPAHAIVLEITESAVMTDPDQAKTVLSTLRSNGIGIAMDDFGTEYSSLSRLATMPFDVLKIDRSFVTEVQSPRGRAIVTAIHALACALGKKTVAEGIETSDQLRIVTGIGCDSVQGFWTGRPMPLAELNSRTPELAPARLPSGLW